MLNPDRNEKESGESKEGEGKLGHSYGQLREKRKIRGGIS